MPERFPRALAAGTSAWLLAAALGCGGGGGGSSSAAPPDPGPNPNVGLEALARFDRIARLRPGVRAHQESSFDLTGGNDDGFSGFDPGTQNRSFLYFDGTEYVLFEKEGAGVVNRIHFAFRGGTSTPSYFFIPGAENYRIRFYFDGETVPRIDLPVTVFVSGSDPAFPYPLAGDDVVSPGGPFVYFPLPFERGLRVATTGLPYFNAFQAHLFPTAEGIRTYTPLEDPAAAIATLSVPPGTDPKPSSPDDPTIAGVLVVPPLGEATIADFAGAGAILALRLRATPSRPGALRLQIAYDGEPAPRVDAPVRLFFGTGIANDAVATVPAGRLASGEGYCFFPMPFSSSARVRLRNDSEEPISATFAVRWRPGVPEGPFGYFHAVHRLDPAPALGEDVVLLQAKGRGHVVGVVLDTADVDPSGPRVYLEGDERIYVDERRTPALHGTGTEEFFNWGWYDGPLDVPFALALHGAPAHLAGGNYEATGQVRWMIADTIPFERSIRVGFEHGPTNEVFAIYESVVFFYGRDEPALVPADEVDPGDPASEAAHGYLVTPPSAALSLSSSFDGPVAPPLVEDGYVVTGESQFVVSIPPANAGVRLLRLSNQGLGRQRAKVFVDGAEAGEWYQAHSNIHRRWLEDVFEIPAAHTAGKTSLWLRFVPVGPAHTWSEFRWRVFARQPGP